MTRRSPCEGASSCRDGPIVARYDRRRPGGVVAGAQPSRGGGDDADPSRSRPQPARTACPGRDADHAPPRAAVRRGRGLGRPAGSARPGLRGLGQERRPAACRRQVERHEAHPARVVQGTGAAGEDRRQRRGRRRARHGQLGQGRRRPGRGHLREGRLRRRPGPRRSHPRASPASSSPRAAAAPWRRWRRRRTGSPCAPRAAWS